MTVAQIYQNYQIPLNLQQHMLRVAAVGSLICENLQTVEIDRELVVSVLLLHDMGNIIKFKFDRVEMFAPDDRQNINRLQQIQVEFKQRYGESADDATLAIMSEIGVSQDVIDLYARSHGGDLARILARDDWEAKICFYSDMRVGPLGVLSLEERFADLVVRYAYKADEIRYQQGLAQQLEAQIQAVCNLDLSEISESIIAPVMIDFSQAD